MYIQNPCYTSIGVNDTAFYKLALDLQKYLCIDYYFLLLNYLIIHLPVEASSTVDGRSAESRSARNTHKCTANNNINFSFYARPKYLWNTKLLSAFSN